MFEVFTVGFSLLNLLSLAAFFTTVGLFFCGIPICRQIWKRKDTREISGAPFLMGVLGILHFQRMLLDDIWIPEKRSHRNGGDWMSSYTLFFVQHFLLANEQRQVKLFGMKVFHPLGIVCMTLNIADFAAPLAGLRVVIRRGATSTLPLPLCIANFMVSSEWFLYGLLVKDIYLIVGLFNVDFVMRSTNSVA
ncbi:hypothetical protein KIN20_003322 [Parelaphostrongylus tenuis]|uniref:Sugar transporter SWEET1 n=1 Tax=Parelaphostrongylus tenuis TaxID=148309 RepID=A0AAD5LYZ5_PARTN|nr:hypothetical protein KIN20_003322 [Parelaphostrongylus tenuis]